MINHTFYTTYNSKLADIFLNDIKLREYPFENRAYYESYDSWSFARVCIGWAQHKTPATAIKLYKDILEVMKEKGLTEDIDCFFGNGNIEFRAKNEDTNEACKELHKKTLKASNDYVEFYSYHSEYINQLISDLESEGKGNDPKDGKETFGHRIAAIPKVSLFTGFEDNEYKGHNLENGFIYYASYRKESSNACIENVKRICSKHAEFTFLTNEKKSEMNGYYCLFIIPKH